ncbi:MAG: hypothetical protein KDB22_12975 [Planctomycetales bacterium]|nr:hypothetical protein [Planctomycetales bacterium]
MSRRGRFLIVSQHYLRPGALICLLIVSGCARWSAKQDSLEGPPQRLPTASMPPDTVIVETVLVRIPAQAEESVNEVWRLVDETVISIHRRKLFDQNGIRVGVLLSEIPKVLRDQLDPSSGVQANQALENAGLAADADQRTHKLQCRSGRRKEIPVRSENGESITILTTADGQRLSGVTLQQATMLFDLRATANGDGSATLKLTPEVQHGETRQSYVSTEFGIRPQMKRQQQIWKELSIEATLQPEQILVVSGTIPSRSLGKAFFTTVTADQSREHVVLLLRLAQTQLDELFAPEVVDQAKALAER